MNSPLEGKNILITGGCGSVGRELVAKLLEHNPNVIRIYDNNETGLYELKKEFSKSNLLRYLIGDIRDKERINKACEDIDIVIHAAALKHVYFCEYNPFEALKTNVQGTQNVIDAALANNVEKMMFTSSDKAVNPTNVMGITKLLAERLVISANYYKGSKKTIFSCLRFGNILGSNGSVIALFKDQIENGGPVTITEKGMTRYIMTKDEATEFIISSIGHSKGGEIFVSKMKAVDIEQLAITLIDKYNTTKSKVQIEYIGKIPGEKLYEELLTENEIMNTSMLGNSYIIYPEFTNLIEIRTNDRKDLILQDQTRSDLDYKLNKSETLDFINKVFEV